VHSSIRLIQQRAVESAVRAGRAGYRKRMEDGSATVNRARTQGDARARTVSRRSLGHSRDASQSRRTVLVALAANAVIAVAKLGGGLLSGSTAMFAEAAHSLADTMNQASCW
jgi:Cation efflux family